MTHIDPHHLHTVGERAQAIMERQQIDVLVASSPENFYYLSGYPSAFLYTLRMSDIGLAVMFRDPARKTLLIMSDFEAAGVPEHLPCEVRTYPTWVDVDDPLALREGIYTGGRPVVPQVKEMFGVLSDVLSEYSLAKGKAAVEFSQMRYPAVLALQEICSSLQCVDASGIFSELRAIKTDWEVEQLRKACAYTETCIEQTVAGIGPGVMAAELVQRFRTAVEGLGSGATPRFHMISAGSLFAPVEQYDTAPAEKGDLIKFDVGIDVNGYGSDIARTFVIGPSSALIDRIYSALRAGHDHLLQSAEPGLPMSRLFDEAKTVIRQTGLENYNRGHLGHSVGLGLSAEEPPFISPSETTLLAPGMVLCLETPYYAYGIGSIMIEDMIVITDSGSERLNRLSRDLISIPT
ncbi:M24 family metallopeptidase [Marinicrinis lubricantis]|uniref:M24 family metallopeptidase n=1 Tax=Marinicrinis lubricantis TaxID=2086470 RepID=A0ABW1IJQ8_9BACL